MTSFATPSLRLIPKGEKSDPFTDLALASIEGCILKDANMPNTHHHTKTTKPTAAGSTPPWIGTKLHRCTDGGPDVELIELRQLVRWLMDVKNLTFHAAAHILYERFAGTGTTLKLYFLSPSGAAEQVCGKHEFGYGWEQIGARKVRNRGINMPPLEYVEMIPRMPDGVQPGLSAAMFFLKREWCNPNQSEHVMDHLFDGIPILAMQSSQAASLFGGVVAAQGGPELLPAKKWTDQALLDLLEKSEKGTKNADLAREIGCVPSYITHLLDKAKTLKYSSGKPLPGKPKKKANSMDVTQSRIVHRITR